ncbi:GntR family transcriptional regulator [candidate division KSB1 bacterium]
MNKSAAFLFQIKPSSGVPIFRQLIDQINRLVVSGYLKSGDELPSVRQAAGELEVNPMTISKAYSILEAMGTLERIRGKGMIVASNQSTNDLKKRIDLIRPVLSEAASQAKQLAIPEDMLMKIFKELLEE